MFRLFRDLYVVGGNSWGLAGHPNDGNICLLKDEGDLFLIDAGTGLGIDQLEDNLNLLGHSLSEIKMIINTHEHWDHTGGDAEVKRRSGCKVACHELVAPVLESGDPFMTCIYCASTPLNFPPVKADIRLKDGDRLKLNSIELEVLHTPGHTPGSTCFLMNKWGKRILFFGDIVGWYSERFKSNYADLVASVEKISKIECDIAVGGHSIECETEQWKDKTVGAVKRGLFTLVKDEWETIIT